MEYKVNLLWDDEARVWVATSEDVPGLILESESDDALIEKVRNAIPELLEIYAEGSAVKMSMRDIPNEETIAAINEAEVLLDDPNTMRFSSVDDLFEELRS